MWGHTEGWIRKHKRNVTAADWNSGPRRKPGCTNTWCSVHLQLMTFSTPSKKQIVLFLFTSPLSRPLPHNGKNRTWRNEPRARVIDKFRFFF
jgi:hypothetical protein